MNHAIPIDDRAVIADSPSTADRVFSPFDSVTYFVRATFPPPPIGFSATKLDMVCVPILRALTPTDRPTGIAQHALK